MTHISNGGSQSDFQLSLMPFEMVLGENNTAFATDSLNVLAFDTTSGQPKWTYTVPNPNNDIVDIVASTAGGGLAAKLTDLSIFPNSPETIVSLDSTGSSTPSQGVGGLMNISWTGNWNGVLNEKVSALAIQKVLIAGTYWALPGGNQAGNSAAVDQVLTTQPQTDEKQLPNLSGPLTCFTGVLLLVDAPPSPTCGNINAIELITDKSPDFIFQKYIQTFFPATLDTRTNASRNSIMLFTGDSNNNIINITGSGQKLNIILNGIARLGQGPFSVLTERFDPVNHIISVVTLKGHPLAGWRYWRVYSIGANDVVIETGAYDQPAPGPLNYLGYIFGKSTVLEGWANYLEFIKIDLQAIEGSNLQGIINGRQVDAYRFDSEALLKGYWDNGAYYTNYILNNVCQSTVCN